MCGADCIEEQVARRVCEMCNGRAELFCKQEKATLCRSCDAQVHGANVIASRHERYWLCELCDCGIAKVCSNSKAQIRAYRKHSFFEERKKEERDEYFFCIWGFLVFLSEGVEWLFQLTGCQVLLEKSWEVKENVKWIENRAREFISQRRPALPC